MCTESVGVNLIRDKWFFIGFQSVALQLKDFWMEVCGTPWQYVGFRGFRILLTAFTFTYVKLYCTQYHVMLDSVTTYNKTLEKKQQKNGPYQAISWFNVDLLSVTLHKCISNVFGNVLHINGLALDCSNSSALAMELLQSYTLGC